MAQVAVDALSVILKPWNLPRPLDAGDADNTLPNKFWTTQTLSGDRSPSGYFTTNGATATTAGAFSTDEDGVVWLTYTFSASPSDFTLSLLSGNRPLAVDGDIYVSSGLIDVQLSAGSVRVQCPARSASPATSYPLFGITQPVKGPWFLEFPANTYVSTQIFVPAGATGTVSLAQMSLVKKSVYT